MYLQDLEMSIKIAELVKENNGVTYYVGGYVRDIIMGLENKDIDIEVHGITPQKLEEILDSLGNRIQIGASFGVYCLKGYSIDIAMPRKEKKLGEGHKDFYIEVDPFIGTYNAAKRRDFTINALMKNVLTGEIIDHFGGQNDIKNKIIRHIDKSTFIEDPLRVLRGCQFASRFGFQICDETIELCKEMSLSSLSKERIMGELEKALLKSSKPSIFFELLRKMNHLSYWFPELEDLIGVEQNPKHHAEGDVWIHTMMVLDKGVEYVNKLTNKLGFMLSCVTHDFGKAICTEIVKGEIHAYDHETKGLPIVERFMKRLTNEKNLINFVLNQTEFHMKPNTLAANNSSIKSTNKMFDQAIEPEALIAIAICDGLGKIAPREYISYDDFFEERLNIFYEYMNRPYVTGKDLINAGVEPNDKFNEYLQYAHKLRLAGVLKEHALKQTLAYIRKK